MLITKLDTHIHSRYSDAPSSTIRKIKQIALKDNLGVCICDHNEIRGSIRLYEDDQVATIPAIEVGSRTNVEFLIYFDDPTKLETYFRTSVEPYKRKKFYARLSRDFEPLVRDAKALGGMVTLPHPFAPGWKNLGTRRHQEDMSRIMDPDFMKLIDFIEVINGHISDKRNFRAYQFAQQNNKRSTVGSDAHTPHDIGKVHVEFRQPVESSELLSTLLENNRMLMNLPFSPWNFMNTARRVFPRHVMLYLNPIKQRVWMDKRARLYGRK